MMGQMPAWSEERMLATNSHRLDSQKPWLDLFPGDIGSILDVGAGAGAHSIYFSQRGYDVVALDFNSELFHFHGQIEFVQGDVMRLDGNRRFDAIFLSHVLEHIPNTLSALLKLRELLNEGGYLFVAVPPYDGRTGNDHWHIGWNCAQLAMWLVAAGFSCTDATFMQMPGNVCGWGRKQDFPSTSFHVANIQKHLPAAWASACYKEGEDDRIPDVAFAAANRVVPRTHQLSLTAQGFRLEEAATVSFTPEEWGECVFDISTPIDLTVRPLELGSLLSADCIYLRIMLSSDASEYDCYTEVHLTVNAGMAVIAVNESNCLNSTERRVDFSSIRRISIGGLGHDKAHFWAAHNGRALKSIVR
jgi:SAM-dependent methyltransferase